MQAPKLHQLVKHMLCQIPGTLFYSQYIGHKPQLTLAIAMTLPVSVWFMTLWKYDVDSTIEMQKKLDVLRSRATWSVNGMKQKTVKKKTQVIVLVEG